MRSLQLETTLTDYIAAAAEHLRAEVAAGAEVPFELEQSSPSRRGMSAGSTSLYCYRPLTASFIEQRAAALQALPGYVEAVDALSEFDGLDRYLASVGCTPEGTSTPRGGTSTPQGGTGEIEARDERSRAGAALGSLLGEVFDGQSDFELSPQRLQSALSRLERSATFSASEVTIVATLHGLTITSPEVALASGLVIAQPSALDGLPTGAKEGATADGHLVVVLAASEQEPHQGLAQGRAVLRELLRALRLFGDGRVTLGPMAWVRIGGASWGPMALGEGGRPHGMLVVTKEQEDELRAFCNLVSRRAPHGNELAWALHRFELACSRSNAYDALTDNLLALRALLEPEGPASGMLPGRLAALCATTEQRLRLTERTVQAIALERAVIEGAATASASSEALATELADHLRALLRDVICGHLPPDLVGLADELLLADEPAPALEPESAPEPTAVPVPATAPVPAAQALANALAPDAATTAARPAPVSSIEQALSDASESEEILDLLI
jgi:hypothetical protein